MSSTWQELKGSNNSLLTGSDLWENQAQDRWSILQQLVEGFRGKRREKRKKSTETQGQNTNHGGEKYKFNVAVVVCKWFRSETRRVETNAQCIISSLSLNGSRIPVPVLTNSYFKKEIPKSNPMEGVRVLNLNLDFVLQERALTAEGSASLHTESQVLKYSIWIIWY